MNTDDRDDTRAPRQQSESSRPDRGDRAGQGTTPPMGGYQEGSVESVGGGPSGTDNEDRTGQAGSTPDVPHAPDNDANRDVFISKEVAERSADAPGGRPERTRS